MAGRWAALAFRWLYFDFSARSPVMRPWPGMLASYITPRWSAARGFNNWSLHRWIRWSSLLNLSIVDELVWRVVTAFESVALVSMLCFFFRFCGRGTI